jgi:hypothetical protein
VPIFIHDPPEGNRLFAVTGHTDFPGRHGASSHIDENGAVEVAGQRDADGVGAQTGDPTAEGCHRFGGFARVGGHHADEPGACRHERVIPDAPHMTLMEDGDGAELIGFRLVDRHLHGPL